MKLFDSEWKVMEVLWQDGDTTAKELSLRLAGSAGWNKNTTYTVIKKCVEKGAIERREPNFLCHACITKEAAQQEEADTLLDKVFRRLGGAAVRVGPERAKAQERGAGTPACAGGGAGGMSGFQAAAVSGSVMILVIALLRLTAGKTAAAGAVSGAVVRGGVSAAAAGAAAVRAERLESDRR